jgi:hypothetical protein
MIQPSFIPPRGIRGIARSNAASEEAYRQRYQREESHTEDLRRRECETGECTGRCIRRLRAVNAGGSTGGERRTTRDRPIGQTPGAATNSGMGSIWRRQQLSLERGVISVSDGKTQAPSLVSTDNQRQFSISSTTPSEKRPSEPSDRFSAHPPGPVPQHQHTGSQIVLSNR